MEACRVDLNDTLKGVIFDKAKWGDFVWCINPRIEITNFKTCL
jgi:hypothetical protein